MLDILDPLLAPLSRFLIARGVLFPDLAERLKAHYVEAARQMAESEGKATDSRISVLTGLQRREVTRLKGFEPRAAKPNHLVRLVALWQTEPAYMADGHPLPLPRNGAAPSFEALARMVRRDVHPRTMLDTLEAAGTVSIDPDTQEVRLEATSYQPLAGSDEQITYLTRNLGDHLEAATENVLAERPPHFERSVSYVGLDEDQIAELDTEFRRGQMALFETLNRKAAAMKAESGGSGAFRFRAGGFFWKGRRDRG